MVERERERERERGRRGCDTSREETAHSRLAGPTLSAAGVHSSERSAALADSSVALKTSSEEAPAAPAIHANSAESAEESLCVWGTVCLSCCFFPPQ